MLAVTFTEFGAPEVLRITELPEPTPGAGEVVVRVSASPVNPTDIMMRLGLQSAMMTDLKPPYITGMEFSGHVHSLGSGVSGLMVGQPVMGVVNPRRPTGGAHSQLVSVPTTSVVPVPQDFDLMVASTVPMNGLTARAALDLLDLRPGSRLLVTGAAGVLGGYVIQLAKRDGLVVVADAKESDVEWLRSLGTDVIVPRDSWEAAVRERFPQGVDAVVDTALLTDRAGALVRNGGAAVSVRKTHPIHDPRLRHHHVAVTEQMNNTVALKQLADLLNDGGLAVRIVDRLRMAEAVQAHRLTEQGGLRGRIVLTFDA